MNSVKIIFADDDIVARKLVLKLLVDVEFNIIIAENGKQAWDLLKASGARLVVTDWVMPEMTGLDLCRKIRAEYMDSYIYIILITSRGEKEDTIEGLKAGADDFIVKPLNMGELTARIRSGMRIIKLEDDFRKASHRLMQSEKMASVGQLAAGVAHEINNPTGFVSSNLKTLGEYQTEINELLLKYRTLKNQIVTGAYPGLESLITGPIQDIENFEKDIDVDYLVNDTRDLIDESREGLERIKKIVMDLKDFAHPGEENMQEADINACLESTLNVIWNEIKYKAEVNKKLGDIPRVLCYPQQLNQVFLNILINAAQAIENSGKISITTEPCKGGVKITITDNGIGIKKEHQSKVFDPFFTTKAVGKGTGLGMNVAYNIIKKHGGSIDFTSEEGRGTSFVIVLPMHTSYSV